MRATGDVVSFSFLNASYHVAEVSAQRWGPGDSESPSPMKRINVEIWLACHQQLVLSVRLVSTSWLQLEAAAICLYLRYSVSYTKIRL